MTPSPGILEDLGLAQSAKLAAATQAVYRHALERALLPRLIWRLEAQMRGNLNRPDFLYEATRVYLMLGGGGPLDRELVRVWENLDWSTAYPRPDDAVLRDSLARHLDALMAEPLPAVALDGQLVEAARATFSRVPLVQRVYSRIRPAAQAQNVPAWRPLDAVGAAGATLFVRASGKPLDAGIPGFYTVDGFHKALLPALAAAVKSVAAESWVLGKKFEFDLSGPQMRTLERDVITQYEGEYAQAWDAMLGDLNVVQLRSIAQAAQDLFILASPDSPMKALLSSIARQVTLSVPPGAAAAPSTQAAAAPSADASRLAALMGASQTTATQAVLPPGHEIDERYKAIRALVGTGGPGAPIDLTLKSLLDMQQTLAKMAAAPITSTTVVTGDDPALAVRAEAARQPQPLARWPWRHRDRRDGAGVVAVRSSRRCPRSTAPAVRVRPARRR